jgi:hypothetical protein
VQGGYGVVFAVMVQILLSITRVAPKALTELKASVMGYNLDRSLKFIPGYKFGGGHWRSVAPKALTERSERQGYKLSRNRKFITVQDINCVQMRVSG